MSISLLIRIKFELCYSDQSWISEIESELKIKQKEKEGFNYEYYTRSEINNELTLINKKIPVKELGEIESSEVY